MTSECLRSRTVQRAALVRRTEVMGQNPITLWQLVSDSGEPNLWQIRYVRNKMKSLPKLTLALMLGLAASYVASGNSRGQAQDAPESKTPSALTKPEGESKAGRGPLREAPSDSPVAESAEARAILDQARQRLLSYQTIKAKLVETVALGQRRFTVQGVYWQGRSSDLKLKMEYRVKLGDTEGSILEVCDGQVLWTQHHIGSETRITRRDVRQILNAASESGAPENFITVELGFGGLPGLFASIGKSMQFDQLKNETIDGQKFVVVEGGWQPDMLKLWKGNNPSAALPDFVPSRVRLYFDPETLFPRRILYLRRNAEQILRPIVSLDFRDVQTDVPVPADAFKFTPPDGVFPEDLTKQFLDQIKNRQVASPVGGPAR